MKTNEPDQQPSPNPENYPNPAPIGDILSRMLKKDDPTYTPLSK
jgi:hypothetical protein